MTASPAPPPTDPSLSTGQGVGQDYLVRSEEKLRVGTQRIVAGYARLEKFTVTETQTITVEVTHEEVRLIQTPSDQPAHEHEQAEPAVAGDTDRWMVLSREEVVVTKRVVPLEQVRLEIYPVTEQRQVTEQVRKEQIDTTPQTTGTAEYYSAAGDLRSDAPAERTHPR